MRRFDDHAPGGRFSGLTANGLPPGFRTVAEQVADAKRGPEEDDQLEV
ncbi:hypothetical protein LAZ40_04575 [Cereibacter sphaeroides]|nr:hypothetical protein [Cereibacter sphaeroides]MCE6958331.1 hypothetical protein [Cereibacter sphaeroides]MCE6971151.1 hypothetical protein [Cereibacter sphaeroides]